MEVAALHSSPLLVIVTITFVTIVIITVFCSLFQWPVGYLSDKIDRRVVFVILTLIASGFCILIIVS